MPTRKKLLVLSVLQGPLNLSIGGDFGGIARRHEPRLGRLHSRKTFFPKPSSSGLATTRWMSSRRRVSLPTAGINRSSPFLKFSRLRKRIIRLWPTSGNNRQIHLVVRTRGRRLWKERLVCGGLAGFDLRQLRGRLVEISYLQLRLQAAAFAHGGLRVRGLCSRQAQEKRDLHRAGMSVAAPLLIEIGGTNIEALASKRARC